MLRADILSTTLTSGTFTAIENSLLILLSHKAPSVTHQNSHGESYNYLCCVTFLKGVECRLLMHNRLHYIQIYEQPGFRDDR